MESSDYYEQLNKKNIMILNRRLKWLNYLKKIKIN